MTNPMVRIKVDEDLPPIIADLLRECGYEASTVVEQQMGGYKDAQLWKAIQLEILTGTIAVATPRGIRLRR